MRLTVLVVQGLVELIGLSAFLAGYFLDVQLLLLTGGVLILLDDFVEMGMGVLNPVFPVFLAIVLAVIFTPWYVGIFWGSAAFKAVGIPTSLMKVLAPKRFLVRAMDKLIL